MVHRIAGLDIPRRLSGAAPSWVLKTACVLLGVGCAVSLRAATNLVAPWVAPYAFIYPASLLATLLGGWEAGAGTVLVAGLLVWMFVVPRTELSGAQMHYQGSAAVIAVLTAAMLIAVGEGFRGGGAPAGGRAQRQAGRTRASEAGGSLAVTSRNGTLAVIHLPPAAASPH